MSVIRLEFPAAYERHLRGVLAIELARIGRDVAFRDRCDGDLLKLAPVDSERIDQERAGRVTILFGIPDGVSDTTTITDLLSGGSPVRRTA